MELSASADVNGQRVSVIITIDPSPVPITPGRNEFIFDIDKRPLTTAATLSDDALTRIQNVLRIEALRVAEITHDDVRTQPILKRDAERVRLAPKARPVTFVTVGTKDEQDEDGNPTIVELWREADGRLVKAPDKIRAFARRAAGEPE
jgi:hypothetical protein